MLTLPRTLLGSVDLDYAVAGFKRGGLHAEAEIHLRRAIEWMTADYTRAKDTEAYYRLGLSLKAQGRAQANVFAKFGEQRTRQFGLAESHYLLGLGHLAAEDHAQAARHFREALNLNRAHV